MSENTLIEWADHTHNPWEGCQKVGPGCDNCYAETRNKRWNKGVAINWGPGAPRRRTSTANWRKPLAWQKNAAAFLRSHGRRQRVFCASLADVFDNEVDPSWRADLFELIEATPNLDWLLLTKRIGNVTTMLSDMLGDIMRSPRGWPWPNVWLGITVVTQEEIDRDLPKLNATPAAVRFLSMEPLLERAVPTWEDLWGAGSRNGIDWVIVGGESGSGARPMHPDWARAVRDACKEAGVPFLFKQWGEWHGPAEPIPGRSLGDELRRGTVQHLHAPGNPEGFFRRGDAYVRRVGKKAAGRLLDGVQHDGYPLSVEGTAAFEVAVVRKSALRPEDVLP